MALRGKDLRQEVVLPGTPDDLVLPQGNSLGELRIELDDDAPGHTRLRLRASAAKDNVWTALKGDPNERIIDRFTHCLPPPPPDAQAQRESVASELERLVGLRDRGVLSADEFEAAKAKVLGS